MYWRAKNKTIVIASNLKTFIHNILQNTTVQSIAAVTAEAAADRLIANPKFVTANAIVVEGFRHNIQRRVRTPFLMRAAIDQ